MSTFCAALDQFIESLERIGIDPEGVALVMRPDDFERLVWRLAAELGGIWPGDGTIVGASPVTYRGLKISEQTA